jgi:dipeptidyl aminopeptidase/acylaminoacyl peptidase
VSHRRSITALAGLLLLVPLAHAQEGTEPVVASDLFRIQQVGGVTASPDGRHVAYTVTQAYREGSGRDEKFGYRTYIWLAPVDGSAPPRPLTRGTTSASGPVWHPSGDTLAFVRSVDGRPQVFLMALSGGEPWPLTRAPQGAGGPVFSPDGRRLVFTSTLTDADLRRERLPVPAWATARPGGRTRPDTTVRGNPDGSLDEIRAWLDRNADDASPRVLTRINFQSETDVDPVYRFPRLYVQDVREGATARPVTRSMRTYAGNAWLPGGRELLVSTNPDSLTLPERLQGGAVLYALDTQTGRVRVFLRWPGRSLFGPTVSPDGSTVAFLTTEDGDVGFAQTEIGLVRLRGSDADGVPRLITVGFDRGPGNLRFSKDGRHLYATAASDGGTPLFRFDVRAAQPEAERLTPYEQGVSSYDIAGTGASSVAVAALTEWSNPYELWRFDLFTRRAPARLSSHNTGWIARKRLSRPEEFKVQRPDGLTVQAWKMAPTSGEGRRPVLLQIHGGPTAMWGPGEASMWHEFQFFASRGWGVVFSNPRGSGGYGYRFQRANERDWGHGPMGDVLAAFDHALETSAWADTSRQLLTGGSYAGYLTAWIVAHTDRFDAAAAQRGVYDLPTFFGEGNAWRLVPNYFGGYPWTDSTVAYQGDTASVREVLQRESPLTYVENIRTPLFIKHGDQDRRTGFVQSEMLYRSLALLGREVEYARYPGATHELSRSGEPKLRMDRLLRIYEFLARYAD